MSESITVELSQRFHLAAQHLARSDQTAPAPPGGAAAVLSDVEAALSACGPVDAVVCLGRLLLDRRHRLGVDTPPQPGAGAGTDGDVLAYLTGQVTEAELQSTFGPQWAHVVAVTRRAATLSVEGAGNLDAAWWAMYPPASGPGAGRTPAYIDAADRAAAAAEAVNQWPPDAAGQAVADAAEMADGDHGPALRSLTWGTGVALATRHLIDGYLFTREHYDELTRLWRAHNGSIHPDDPANPGAPDGEVSSVTSSA